MFDLIAHDCSMPLIVLSYANAVQPPTSYKYPLQCENVILPSRTHHSRDTILLPIRRLLRTFTTLVKTKAAGEKNPSTLKRLTS
jgi:hypothetical protein